MHNPGLDPSHFNPDRKLEKQRLIGPIDFALTVGAESDEHGGLFQAKGNFNLVMDRCEFDFSKYNQLSLRMINRSEQTLLVGLSLIHRPLSPGLDQQPRSFSGGREPARPNEWREIKFPRDCFGIYGRPDGWTGIKQVVIHISHEKTALNPFPIIAVLHSLEGELLDIPKRDEIMIPAQEQLIVELYSK